MRSPPPSPSGVRSTAVSTQTSTTTTTRPTTEGRRRREALRAAALVAPIYLLATIVPQGGLARGREYRDVGLYGQYAHGLLDGRIPYRDVFVEYPPGAFVVLTPPALLPDEAYRHAFKALMAVVGVATLVTAALILARLGVRRRRLYVTLVALALTPLALGPVSLNTYDAWPALLAAGALCAVLYAQPTLGFALLGLAVTAKLYPIALLPLFCLAVAPRALSRPLLAFGAVVLAVVGPFALIGRDGLWESIEAQAGRSLQVESLGGAMLLAADRIGVYDADVVGGSTAAVSRDLAGAVPDTLAAISSGLQLAAVLLVVWLVARTAIDGERLVAGSAATVAGVLAFAKFISPQYLVWLLPLVPLVAPPLGVVASIALAGAMVLGQLWFFHYRDLFAVEGIVWLVVLRDVLLVAVYGALAVAVFRLSTKMPSSSSTVRQRP
ncbi:MAG TPA: glycosyltransferase family 87 protein, partial [Gaiellaceae bacterium]|nr:glycosyltransferase family 87 protein [Gaiellaceae bacterium]